MNKRLCSVIIACFIILSFSTSSIAADSSYTPDFLVKSSVEPYASAYLSDYSISFGARDNCRMVITMDVNGVRTMDKIGCQMLVIEKKINGEWILDEILLGIDHPDFYEYNTPSYFGSTDFYGVAGVQYRVTMTAYALDSTGHDTGEVTSYVVTCRE